MAEWSIALVLKTSKGQPFVSSNLTASAKYSIKSMTYIKFLILTHIEVTTKRPLPMLPSKTLSVAELLVLHAQIGEELRERGVVRSANNPTGDLAEYLFCRAFGWQQAPNSERGYDATGADGTRYQIKGRRIHHRNKSRQLSAIRDISRMLKFSLIPSATDL